MAYLGVQTERAWCLFRKPPLVHVRVFFNKFAHKHYKRLKLIKEIVPILKRKYEIIRNNLLRVGFIKLINGEICTKSDVYALFV
jgi:hypothetical protein